MSTMPSHLIGRLHRKDRGAISVLLLLTILALVAMIGLVWNSSEVATRRQHIQTAADATAHSAATWMARTLNVVAAQNMLICQDASAETIARSVPVTSTWLHDELNSELAKVLMLMANGEPNFERIRRYLLGHLVDIDVRYQLAKTAWDQINTIAAEESTKIIDLDQRKKFLDNVSQAGAVLQWIQGTYVDGNPSGVAGWPGPPGGGGQGLRQLFATWEKVKKFDEVDLEMILEAVQDEMDILSGGFDARTSSVVTDDAVERLQAHQQEIYENQRRMVNLLAETLEKQRVSIASFYKCDAMYAVPSTDAKTRSFATINPVISADHVESETRFDTIRGYTVKLDPINANSIVHGSDARIIYPTVSESIPADIIAQYPSVPSTFQISCNYPGGWGHMNGAPVAHYFLERVGRDSQTLRGELQPIDDRRLQLSDDIRRRHPETTNIVITPLPSILPPSIAVPPDINLGLSDETKGKFSTDLKMSITEYKRNADRYVGAVRQMVGDLRRGYGMPMAIMEFTRPIAVWQWYYTVRAFREAVLQQLGSDGRFFVLGSYRLHPIPEWAKEGMRISTQLWVRDYIVYSNSVRQLRQSIMNSLLYSDPAAAARLSESLSKVITMIVSRVANRVATEIAAEYINRSWPYEIAPPASGDKLPAGMGKDDRLSWFSVIAGAQSTEESKAKLFLEKMFKNTPTSLVAFAQAEAFNWNEYHQGYGAADTYDQIHQQWEWVVTATPPFWRLCTIGGWNWNPRLALSDGLPSALKNNEELQNMLNVKSDEEQDDDPLILH